MVKGLVKESYDAVRIAVQDPSNKWVNYINSVIDEANPEFIKKTALNLGYEAFFRGTKQSVKTEKNIIVISLGSFFLIQQVPAICIVKDAEWYLWT